MDGSADLRLICEPYPSSINSFTRDLNSKGKRFTVNKTLSQIIKNVMYQQNWLAASHYPLQYQNQGWVGGCVIQKAFCTSIPLLECQNIPNRWRFMQSRGRQAEGRMIEGFGSNRFVQDFQNHKYVKTQNDQNFAFCRKSVSMQPVSSSFSVLSRPSPSIPYRCPSLPKNN